MISVPEKDILKKFRYYYYKAHKHFSLSLSYPRWNMTNGMGMSTCIFICLFKYRIVLIFNERPSTYQVSRVYRYKIWFMNFSYETLHGKIIKEQYE